MHGWPVLRAQLSIAVLTVLAALPWGLPPQGRFVLPLIPLIAIHFWTLADQNRVPEWFVFATGLTLDVLTNGPLGFWSLIYLLGYVLSSLTAASSRRIRFGGWPTFAAVVSILAAAEWAASSLYYFEAADWWPLVLAVIAAVVAYPVLAGLLGLLDRSPANALSSTGRGAER